MKRFVLLLLVLLLALVIVSQAEERVQFSFKKLKNKVSKSFKKTKAAIKKSGKKIKSAAKKVGKKIKSSAKKAGQKVKKAGKKVKNAAKKFGKKVKNAAKKFGKKVKNAAKKVGKKVKNAAKKLKNAFKSLPKPKRATALTVPLLAAHASHFAYKKGRYLDYEFDRSKIITTLDSNGGRQRIITKLLVNDKLNLVVVSIRGTDVKSIRDIADNLKTKLVNCELRDSHGNTRTYGKVHKGFWKDAKQHFTMVRDSVKPFVKLGYGILLTGHSQGGAEATIMALYLALQFPRISGKKLRLVTFGSPRVGNKQFVKAVNDNVSSITRYVTKAKGIGGSDPITSVPPAGKYQHVGQKVSLYCSKILGFACHGIANYASGLGGRLP